MVKTRKHVDDLRGAGRLAVEATRGVTALVEAMHRTIGSGPAVLGKPLAGPVEVGTAAVYGAIRGVSGVVGAGIDAALAGVGPLLGESTPGPAREALLSGLCGVLGDYLEDTGNPLALSMLLRRGGVALPVSDLKAMAEAVPDASSSILLTVHGSCMNDRQWRYKEHDHADALQEALGWTRVDAVYNSGLHISTNGRTLATQLEALVDAWPTGVERIVVLGHSMGGLVARSACRIAEDTPLRWRGLLGGLVCLGTPHHGAPLERGGNGIDVLLGLSPYSAPLAGLGKIRSAGVTDLRYGNVLDAHWEGRDRFEPGADRRSPVPLPAGVDCYAVAGQRGRGGDGLVPVDSALGRHRDAQQTLAFAAEHTLVVPETSHLDLLGHPDIYTQLEAWLR
ncbi:MAG: esterase/lipase family protein [Nannocystales bacterium]